MVQRSPSARQQWKALILENDFVWFHSFIHPSIHNGDDGYCHDDACVNSSFKARWHITFDL